MLAVNTFIYVVLLSLGFIFLYPLLYMMVTSLMNAADLASPDVVWIPRKLDFQNYYLAGWGINFWEGLKASIFLSFISAGVQTLSCAVVGYGFARYKFREKNILFILVLFTFIVPPQTIIIPLFMQFSRYGWINTPLPFIIPGLLGHGLRGALFVVVYRQFFLQLPWELDDSARIDGLNGFQIFFRIMLPLSKTAMLVIFLFSLVWNWNDAFLPAIFLKGENAPLSVNLAGLWENIRNIFIMGNDVFNQDRITQSPYFQAVANRHEGVGMAACLMVIGFPLVIYLFLQKFFIESIERTGLVE
jgi:multiple sugar transport system permease protein